MNTPRIPLLDLTAQYRAIQPELDDAVRRVMASGQFILGSEVEALERELAAYCGTTHAVAVASGTDALELALRACGIGPGDEVLTTAFSFFATVETIVAVGATPVFVDIELATYNFDPEQLAERVTPNTKAIVPVHLYGHPCDLNAVRQVAQRHRLKVIEDCAQAIGAAFQGKRVGGFGDAGCLSFYPTKNLGGYGDGGMVLTNDEAVAEQVRLLRAHGAHQRYHHIAMGRNSRLDELQAAMLRVKLAHLDAWNEARRRHAARYDEAFHRRRLDGVVLPKELAGCRHVYHLYTVRLPQRDRVKEYLAKQGIATQVAYPSTLPAQPALAALAKRFSPVPRAEQASREILSLPMYPELTPEAIELVMTQVAAALQAS